MTQPLPAHARVVIVGGGVVGCSVAYHLAKLGLTDVLLLERRQLACGTTWHAAGLIAQLRASINMTRLARYSQELYGALEAETGVSTGFRRNGSISVALTAARMEELRRNAAMARVHGVEAEVISPAECLDLHPMLDLTGVVGGVHVPLDGQGDPSNITQALAAGARRLGARIVEGVKVTGVIREGGRAAGVETAQGRVTAEIVVNCAGMWARDFGAAAGVAVPLHAAEHFYMVTEPVPDMPAHLPTLRVPDECAYYKEDAGRILLGAFEPVAKPWGMEGIPEDFCFDDLPPDFEHVAPILEAALARMPALNGVGIRTFFNGPESFTPDDRYLLGEAPELPGFYVAAGFNSVGIQSAGGAGKALAEWIVEGEPPFDLWDVDIRRMAPFQAGKRFLRARVSETLGLLYADHWPYRQYATARGLRRTPFHDRWAALGACFGETAGWERPHWFLPEAARAAGETAEYRYSWGRQNWFPHSAGEHRATREGAALYDLSAFGKIRVEGPDALAWLDLVCAGDPDVPAGRLVYTQWLNARGGVEADVTVARLSETAFLVITPAATLRRDMAWLTRAAPEGCRAVAVDVTSGEAVLGLMGPRSREILAAATLDDVSAEAIPFGAVAEIELGMAPVRIHRVSYVGELGFEIYVSADFAAHAFEALWEAGAPLGLRPAGMHAMDSCRLEKAFRHFGHDITDEDHVVEAGLGFAVKAKRAPGRFGPFIGRDAVLKARETGVSRRLVQFLLEDPEPLLFHGEPIWRGETLAGHVTSAAYGHTLGGTVALGYVETSPEESVEDLLAADWRIESGSGRHTARASLRPMLDPSGARMKG
ncbi:4-methylaminobutanoate oxidase (formaldehyde-forming) [Albimonas donghaensis]|uniref:4-methylaminobutanoate oxidase (Formaldehyde-forming) n=1 Tax=Albimonas donghaensis TaxID=356660 RepID=A0A1H2TMU4_9RHOB|nr:FAD-dependent oxidoreductase [Albimonas donghaensis]SDW44584.1 4-methylaminobutanoate oxidase (formaldehyde-forming) [Albimonas donghaensis]